MTVFLSTMVGVEQEGHDVSPRGDEGSVLVKGNSDELSNGDDVCLYKLKKESTS